MGKIVAVDYGSRRIGLALGEPTLGVAMPWRTIEASGRPADDAELVWRELAASGEEIDAIVLGLPLNMDGSEGPQAKLTRRFGEALSRVGGLDVQYWDERLSSFDAEQRYHVPEKSTSKRSRPPRKPRRPLDAVAAAVILEAYLRHRQGNT